MKITSNLTTFKESGIPHKPGLMGLNANQTMSTSWWTSNLTQELAVSVPDTLKGISSTMSAGANIFVLCQLL